MFHWKMLILRGNSAEAGTYPDEQGNLIAWPKGALHEGAALDYASLKGYQGIVVDAAGQPQSQTSPQAKAALKLFLGDENVTAFYGFSGGGYNLYHILQYLAANEPDSLHRIDRIVVLGAPLRHSIEYEAITYNKIARKKAASGKWQDASWEVVYRTNPPRSAMPKGLPKDLDTHMFGPDALLAEKPEGK